MTQQSTPATSTATLTALAERVTIRRYTDQDIDQELLLTLLNTARRSPTSSNMQAYSFVVVRDQAKKAKLSELSGNQRHVAECPVFVAICADVSRLRYAAEMHGATLAQNTENTLVATVDAAIVGTSLSTVAESVGLGTVMIGGMRNHPDQVGEVLGLPQGVYVVYGLCLGWPDETQRPKQKPRLPQDLIIHFEEYDTSDPAEKLQGHNEELAAHYGKASLNNAAWTGVIADKFSTPKRPHLRETLEKMGFSFE